MTVIVPKDFDQFIRLAMACPVQVYVKTSSLPNIYTVACLPLDMVITGVSQANLNKGIAALTSMEEVSSIT